MKDKRRENPIFLIGTLTVAFLSMAFVSGMGYLNYRTAALALNEQVITRIESDLVVDLETAMSFGKSFENFYGVEDLFANFERQIEGTLPFILDGNGELLYISRDGGRDPGQAEAFLASREFVRDFPQLDAAEGGVIKRGNSEAVFYPIHQEEETVGYMGCLFSDSIFDESFRPLERSLFVQNGVVALLVVMAMSLFMQVLGQGMGDYQKKLASLLILALAILSLSFTSIYSFQADYREKSHESIELSLRNLEEKIEHVQEQGVNLAEVDGVKEYLQSHVSNIGVLRSVQINERIAAVENTDEESDLISFVFGGKEQEHSLYLVAEISDNAMRSQMRSIILVLLSTLVILLIFVFEFTYLIDLLAAKAEGGQKGEQKLSEKQVGIALRFTAFLCSTAEYMCVPYAAMMIRAGGESLFGLSLGMTAALPLTLEGLTQMGAMLVLPKLVRRLNIKRTLAVSSVLMVLCNVTAFLSGRALTIVLCRAAAGVAYAGFKQVSNFLITTGYETQAGRGENISQDNAGLLAGATCGAGLGAILSANLGYSFIFLVSAGLFVAYLAGTALLIPWRLLEAKKHEQEEHAPIRLKALWRMVTSPDMLFYIVAVGIPLNIGVMLCVTLIPAICQTRGISSVVLSYCYIANGIAGIYVGPALVSWAEKRLGNALSIAIAFGLTAASIFILHVPPVIVMVMVSSMILGFLDGFGTPMCTDFFMSLKAVRTAVDEPTALLFSTVLSYVLLTFAPMIAELLLLPGKGAFSPMLIGAILYGAAAAALFFYAGGKKILGNKAQ